MRSTTGLDNLSGWARQQGKPVTLAIIASFTLVALVFWFTQSEGLASLVIAADSHQRPWSFLTYPWANMPFADPFGILFFVIAMIWLYMAGGMVEKDLGTVRYALLWLASTLLVGLVMWMGIHVANAQGYVVAGLYLTLGAITAVWCARNMTSVIMLYGLIPLSGKWLAVVDVVIVILVYGSRSPIMGAFAALPIVALFFWAADRIPGFGYSGRPRAVQATRAQARYDDKYYADVKNREREREERERLRKLFEGSIKDDDKQ